MPEKSKPFCGQDAADLGRAMVSESVERDTEIVRDLLSAIWVEASIDDWLVGRNAFLDGARPIDVLKANDLP